MHVHRAQLANVHCPIKFFEILPVDEEASIVVNVLNFVLFLSDIALQGDYDRLNLLDPVIVGIHQAFLLETQLACLLVPDCGR